MPRRKALPVQAASARAEAQEVHHALYDRINDDLLEYYAAMRELALGAWELVTVKGPDGEQEVRAYRRLPDPEMLRYLNDRVLGRPVTRQESGAIGETESYEQLLQRAVASRKALAPGPVVVEGEARELPPGDDLAGPIRAGSAVPADPEREDLVARLLGSL